MADFGVIFAFIFCFDIEGLACTFFLDDSSLSKTELDTASFNKFKIDLPLEHLNLRSCRPFVKYSRRQGTSHDRVCPHEIFWFSNSCAL